MSTGLKAPASSLFFAVLLSEHRQGKGERRMMVGPAAFPATFWGQAHLTRMHNSESDSKSALKMGHLEECLVWKARRQSWERVRPHFRQKWRPNTRGTESVLEGKRLTRLSKQRAKLRCLDRRDGSFCFIVKYWLLKCWYFGKLLQLSRTRS